MEKCDLVRGGSVARCFTGKNSAIAEARGTSVRTVANQIQAIFKKLGVSSRSELVALLSG